MIHKLGVAKPAERAVDAFVVGRYEAVGGFEDEVFDLTHVFLAVFERQHYPEGELAFAVGVFPAGEEGLFIVIEWFQWVPWLVISMLPIVYYSGYTTVKNIG